MSERSERILGRLHGRPIEQIEGARKRGLNRRSWLDLVGKGLALGGLDALARPRLARAFGDDGAFEPKVLLAGGVTGAAHASAPGRWSVELEKRTSAPSRRFPRAVKATDPLLLDGPFAYWSGTGGLSPLDKAEIAAMRQFLALGGLLVVDDADPEAGNFGKDARREVARILPDAAPVVVPAEHVLYRTFYLLKPARPWGRANGPATADAIIRAGQVRVLFLSHDLGGALAKNTLGTWEATVEPGGEKQRELAIRFAVNVAMYALTTNYKDDAVHAPYLLKRKTVAP